MADLTSKDRVSANDTPKNKHGIKPENRKDFKESLETITRFIEATSEKRMQCLLSTKR